MKATVRYSQNQDIKMPSARKLASQEFMNHSRDTKKNHFTEAEQLLGLSVIAL